eukprot:14299711-Ditylum_brightwellii.AAC.1
MVLPIIVIATKVALQQEKRHYKCGKKSHHMALECLEVSMITAYTHPFPCYCSDPFQQKHYMLS